MQVTKVEPKDVYTNDNNNIIGLGTVDGGVAIYTSFEIVLTLLGALDPTSAATMQRHKADFLAGVIQANNRSK
jgi:hypothetical protein